MRTAKRVILALLILGALTRIVFYISMHGVNLIGAVFVGAVAVMVVCVWIVRREKKPPVLVAAVFGVLAAGFLVMPLARADGNVDEFYQYLLQHNMSAGNNSANGITYVQNGRDVCAAMRAGAVPNPEQWLLQHGMDRAGASVVAFAAPRYLCPGN